MRRPNLALPRPAVILVLAGFLLIARAPGGVAGEPSTAARLVAAGFENVSVHATETGLTVRYENRVFRYELHALGVVAAAALDDAGERTLTLIPLNRGVPILMLSAPGPAWRAFLAGETTPEGFAAALRIRSDGPMPPAAGSPPPLNRSFGRTDVAVRPLFSFELGIADDPFRSALYLAPEATMAPGTGALLTLQGAVRVYDDLDPFARRVAPGRSTLSWGGWLPGGLLTAASAGYFSGNRYGVVMETSRLLAGGGLEIRAGADLSGFLKFSRDVTLYSDLEAWSAFLAGTCRPRGIDVAATLTAARFMEGDLGARADVSRRFGETEVGFFAIETEDDSVVGFEIELPLPRRELPRPRAVRPATVPAFPFEYRDTAQRIGLQVSHFDNATRLRKGLHPTFVLNNIEDLRAPAPAPPRPGKPRPPDRPSAG